MNTKLASTLCSFSGGLLLGDTAYKAYQGNFVIAVLVSAITILLLSLGCNLNRND